MTSPVDLAERPPIASLRLGRPFPDVTVAFTLLVGGIATAIATGVLIALGLPQVAFGVAVALPLIAIVTREPFAGLLIWILTVPYFGNLNTETSPAIWAVHRIGVPVVLILVATHTRLGWRRWGLRFGPTDFGLAIFIGIGLINVIYLTPSVSRMTAAFHDKLIIPIMLYWLVRALAPQRREFVALTMAGLFTIVVQSAVGILTWIAPSILPSGWLGRAGERTTGTVEGPGPFTVTLVLFALLAVHLAARSPSVRRRATLIGFATLAAVGVFLSLSRGSWLGAGLAMAGLAVVHRRIVGVGAMIGFAVLVGLSFGPLADQFSVAQQRIGDVDTVESRIITNDAATRMIAARPITGFGFGQFEQYDESFKRRVGDIPLKLGGGAHNTYLNMLAEVGIPATILYLGVPVVLLMTTFRRWRSLPRSGLVDRALVVVLWLSALDQFVVQNFIEMIHASFWGTSLWWLTLGMIATILDRTSTRRNFGAGSAA